MEPDDAGDALIAAKERADEERTNNGPELMEF